MLGPGRPFRLLLPTSPVILSAAKDLGARRVRPFAALRVTLDGMLPGERGGRPGTAAEVNAYGVAPTIRRVGLPRPFIVRVYGCLPSTRVIHIPVPTIYESTCARVL